MGILKSRYTLHFCNYISQILHSFFLICYSNMLIELKLLLVVLYDILSVSHTEQKNKEKGGK